MATRTRPLTEGEQAELEEQRDFLLRSLEDLDAEHEAGDVDDNDYEALRDDYTTRAAAVLRTLEAGRVREHRRAIQPANRTLAALVGIVLFAAGAGVLVARTSGERGSGDTPTGEIRETTRAQLQEAVSLVNAGDIDGAIDVYDEILEQYPSHVEALTYKGWFLFLQSWPPETASSDEWDEAVRLMGEAIQVDPEYPDARAFLAVANYRIGQGVPDMQEVFFDQARSQLEALDELDPPDDGMIQQLIGPIREDLGVDGDETEDAEVTSDAEAA